MMDMTGVIQPKSDQINADDLIGQPMTVTVDAVHIDPKSDQPINVRLVGMKKVFRPCKSMARVMVQAWGADASKYAGKSMTLYRDPKVKWGGVEVGGIRISHMSHIDKPLSLMLTQTRSQRAAFKVGVLQASQPPADDPAPTAPPDAWERASAAAEQGTDAFRAWWGTDDGVACRPTVKPRLAELQAIAAKADASANPGAEDGDDECPI